VRVHPTGSVTVFTGSHSHGQGHETTFAQVVADKLGIPMEVSIEHGDTDRIPFGMGTYGSRSLAVGGSAIVKALDKIIAKGKKIAAHLLEASTPTSSSRTASSRSPAPTRRSRRSARSRSRPTCRTTTRSTSWSRASNENAFYDPSNFTYPGGTYICEVEVDPDTGHTRGRAVTAVADDFGNDHQPDDRRGPGARRPGPGHRPGAAGAGVYDAETGQLTDRQLHGLRMPRADDLPSFKVGNHVTPAPTTRWA
jgi:carbon-monoxide dehydrogenase large subunit